MGMTGAKDRDSGETSCTHLLLGWIWGEGMAAILGWDRSCYGRIARLLDTKISVIQQTKAVMKYGLSLTKPINETSSKLWLPKSFVCLGRPSRKHF